MKTKYYKNIYSGYVFKFENSKWYMLDKQHNWKNVYPFPPNNIKWISKKEAFISILGI